MPLSTFELVLRLGVSALLGGAIGFERELREHPAGLRTHLLVTLASAAFMIISTQFVFYQHYAGVDIGRADVSRIAANVVVGMGFLGAGVILRSGYQIKGLTTAASLWLVSAVGLASGAGMFALAILTTGISLCALIGLRRFEQNMRSTLRVRIRLDLGGESLSLDELERALSGIGAGVKQSTFSVDRVRNRSSLRCEVSLPHRDLEAPALRILESLPAVRDISVQQVGD